MEAADTTMGIIALLVGLATLALAYVIGELIDILKDLFFG